jgi:hypothetical protein
VASSRDMRESGQATVEWLAVCVAVLAFGGVAAVVAPGAVPAITGGLETQICHVVRRSCAGPAAMPGPAAAQAQVAPPAAAPAPAQPPATPDRDLCGSSYCNVPELWFNAACGNHDRRYDAHRGKAACDTAFLDDMLATCAKLPSSPSGVNSSFTRAACRAAAHLYYKGVVVGGGFSYCHRPVCREGE